MLGPIPKDVDSNTELKRRLRLWEEGQFNELVMHVAGQQADGAHEKARNADDYSEVSDEQRARAAKQKTAAKATSKAVKGLVGGIAQGNAEQREQWTKDLIPRSAIPDGVCSAEEAEDAKVCSWGNGDYQVAKKAMSKARDGGQGQEGLPWVSLAPLRLFGRPSRAP